MNLYTHGDTSRNKPWEIMVSATYYTYSVQVLWEIEKEFLFLPIYTFTSLNYFIIYSSLSWESIATA
jgi:hypothetical protein